MEVRTHIVSVSFGLESDVASDNFRTDLHVQVTCGIKNTPVKSGTITPERWENV